MEAIDVLKALDKYLNDPERVIPPEQEPFTPNLKTQAQILDYLNRNEEEDDQ